MLQLLRNTRLVVSVLAIVALVLGTLIYRDIFVPAKPASSSLNLYTVARRTVTSSVTGTGNLAPETQANVSFKVAGTLTAIYVTVGDHVSVGQSLAAIDATSEQNAVTAAQANVATAEANLQAVETPLTSNQITQLKDAVTTAQQSYSDAVAQTNLTNSSDAAQVAADQNQLNGDKQTLDFMVVAGKTYQGWELQLSTDQGTLAAAIATFNADGCKAYVYPYAPPAPAPCAADFTTVQGDQTTVASDQASITAGFGATLAAVNADQSKLNTDSAKQTTDRVSGQHNVNQALASLTNAQDQLKTQTESRPNQVLAAEAQLAQSQAALQAAQQNLSSTTLVSPMTGVVNSINGVVGEGVSPGAGSTPEAPGSQAPLPTSAAGSSFMVIGNVSSMEAIVPFAESDASRLAFNQDAQITFDAVPNLTISGHVVAVASDSTVTSGVVDYYATVSLNQTNSALKQGMTANATVTVSKATNALVVPNNAITRVGGQAYVNLYVSGQIVQTAVETGVVGDQFTEVTGGLNDGAQIVLPTVRVSTSTTSGGTRGTFGGGGGGGGVRIGG